MPDKTVFVVDDDAAVTQGLRFMLRTGGYSVDAFPSARSFLEGYDPRRGGCLLLDIRMPRMTGPELQQQLNVRGWRIPVIFITGHGSVSLAIAAMQAGAFDFIEKPLREDALIESIERALRWNDRAYEERLERATVQARVAALTPTARTRGLRAGGHGRAQQGHRPPTRHQPPYGRVASRRYRREAASGKPGGLDPHGDNHQLQSDYLIPLRRSLGADIVPQPLTARSRPADTADPKDGRLCRLLTSKRQLNLESSDVPARRRKLAFLSGQACCFAYWRSPHRA